MFIIKDGVNPSPEDGNLKGHISNSVGNNNNIPENIELEKKSSPHPVDKLSENSSIEKEGASTNSRIKPMDYDPLLDGVKV